MKWHLSWSTDPIARDIADRHYNRQKIGSRRFMPPGRCKVLLYEDNTALWGTSWPFAEYVLHAWAGAWVNSIFRKESGEDKNSDMIREAVACTRYLYPDVPELGMVTFIDPEKVKPIKVRGVDTWGYSYLKAGFENVGFTKGGLVALQLWPCNMPKAESPLEVQERLFA
jgi:hypothetical protein